MRAVRCIVLFIAFALCAPAIAQTPAASPLIGHWTLDVATLPMPPDARPRRVTLDFRDAGDNQWSSRVEIVDQAGKTLTSESTLSLDGTPGRASGTYWVDVCAAKMPASNVLVMQFAYQGKPTSTRVFSVGADADSLTETEAYFKPDGTPAMRTATYTRTH